MPFDADLVTAAHALLDLTPPPQPEPKPLKMLVSPPRKAKAKRYGAFRSLAPDSPPPSSPIAVSVASEGSSVASWDGYTSESTLMVVESNPTKTNAMSNSSSGGGISLAMEDDHESLSPLHCFMRRYCVEAFCASEQDLTVPRYGKSHSGKVGVGQVGIRCLHCVHRPAHERQERAVCFPSSLKNIYHSIETWQRRHSLVCQDLPVWIKKSMAELMLKSRAGAGGRRQYWEESARRLGMETTLQGVRFFHAPTLSRASDPVAVPGGTAMTTTEEVPSVPVVHEADTFLITHYLYTLLEQMESCRFSEEDRTGGRSKVKNCPVGFPGMQCKHCRGKAGFGRYFPTTATALASANSDRNIFNHISKCRACPVQMREELCLLQKQHATCKNRRGSRKQFFESVWRRLHQSQQN